VADEMRYVVLRANWRRTENGLFVRLPGEDVVQSFGLRDDADAFAANQEADARAQVVNPFALSKDFSDLSHMPEGVFADWVQDSEVEPPKEIDASGRRDWLLWWKHRVENFSDSQARHIVSGLTKVWFYRVEERSAKNVAYVVVQILWEYNDTWYEPGTEGGVPVQGFRSRANAEAYLKLMEEQARANLPDRCEITRWAYPNRLAEIPKTDHGWSDSVVAEDEPHRVPVYEIVEVELEEES
jgi:hypothetical protein